MKINSVDGTIREVTSNTDLHNHLPEHGGKLKPFYKRDTSGSVD